MRARIAAERASPARSNAATMAGVTSSPRASSTIGTTASRASRSCAVSRRRFPQAVMRGQRAVMRAERAEPPVEQGEMHRLVRADARANRR